MPLVTIRPTADSGTPAWTPTGAATNWEAVSDGDDATYNTSGVPSDLDLFTLANLPGAATTVHDVSLRFRARTDAPYPGVAQFHAVWQIGTDQLVSSPVQVDYGAGGAWFYYTLSGLACPDGGAWSVAKVNSLVAGYEMHVTPSGKSIEVAEVYADVTYNETAPLVAIPSADVLLTRTAAGPVELTRTAAGDVFLGRTG